MEQTFGLTIPRALEEVCDPRHLALLVYDMQVGVVGPLPDGAQMITDVAAAPRAPPLRAGTSFAERFRRAYAGEFPPARPKNPRDLL